MQDCEQVAEPLRKWVRKKEKLETLQVLKTGTAQRLRRKTPEQIAKVQIPAQPSSSPPGKVPNQ